jgi:hypothetical protein
VQSSQFDIIARRFAARRLSRRQALRHGGAGITAGVLAAAGRTSGLALDATPEASADASAGSGQKVAYLFVQSFQSGSVAPKDGAEGTYTLTLEQGLGQTIYFSDRPERVVGAVPTAQFLKGLGFLPDNPPNAALVVEAGPGDEGIAVLELSNPRYDEATKTATYDAKVLQDWERTLEMGFAEAPTDLAQLASSFGAAHLFIDECPNADIVCHDANDNDVGSFADQPMCWNFSTCIPCEPSGHAQPEYCATYNYWIARCNAQYPSCKGRCTAENGWIWGDFCQFP